MIGNYGWHRIGVHFHWEASVDTERPYPKTGKTNTVCYSAYSELYVDGVMVWKVLNNTQGAWDGSEWKDRNDGLRINGIELFRADTAAKEGATRYGDLWLRDNADLIVEMKIQNIRDAENAVYVVIDDVHWTCGDGFVRNVVPNDTPADTTVVLDEGVEVPGAVYFKLAD